MPILASVRDRPTWIAGSPRCWQPTAAADPAGKQVVFGFDITDDDAGHYLLVCFSMDGS